MRPVCIGRERFARRRDLCITGELAGAFRLGGDVDEAYRYGVGMIVDALALPRDRRARRP